MKKFLAIVHDIHAAITDESIHLTLKKHYGECIFDAISFSHIRLRHGNNSDFFWQSLKAEQEKHFEDVISPIIQSNPDKEIVYFGLAPIPLCIHLGHLLRDIPKVTVFQFHHDNKDWHWTGEKKFKPIIENLPQEVFLGAGNVIIRIGTYAPVNEVYTDHLVENIIKEIDFYAENTHRDAIGSIAEVEKYASNFREILDVLHQNLPKVEEIHLFAAVPCGLAFLMGRVIQPNIDPYIHTYQFSYNEDPQYSEAFIIQQESLRTMIITEEEKQFAAHLRKEFDKHFKQDIVYFLTELSGNEEKNWFKSLFPKNSSTLFSTVLWDYLKKIDETNLKESCFSEIPLDEFEAKCYVEGAWYFSDIFLTGLNRKFEKDELNIALRLFIFHEVIHVGGHNIHSDNTEGIGRYPRVLEEADYQADVYAMLHEYSFSKKLASQNIPEFFARLIQVAIQTMWVFDEFSNTQTMQTRRVNRYLIWYFQLARIKDAQCKNLDDVLNILANKPLIDIKLPMRMEIKDRVYFDLKRYKKEDLGIAVFYHNRFKSFGNNGLQLSLNTLVDGLRDQNVKEIETVMRQLLAELN